MPDGGDVGDHFAAPEGIYHTHIRCGGDGRGVVELGAEGGGPLISH